MSDVIVVKIVDQGPQGVPAPADLLEQVQGALDSAVAQTASNSVATTTARNQAVAAKSDAQAASAEAVAAAATSQSVFGLFADSTSSVAIGTGDKTFTVPTGKNFAAGMPVRVSSKANPETVYMLGTVKSYAGSVLVITSTGAFGTGSRNDWSVLVLGIPLVTALPPRLDYDSGSLRASFRDEGTGKAGWYVGASGSADGSQVRAVTVDPAGPVEFSNAPTSGNNPAATLKNPGTGQALKFGIWYGGAANGWIDAEAPLLLNPAGGNVGIGVPTSSGVTSKLTVQGAGTTFVSVVDSTAGGAAYFGYGGSYGYVGATGASNFAIQTGGSDRVLISSTSLQPAADNELDAGTPSYRFKTYYGVDGAINTSDAREKTAVRSLSKAEIAAARDLSLEIGAFQWLAAVDAKGADNARLHIGTTVQRAIEIMEKHGLDPWRYGFICRDEITRRVKLTRKEVEQAGLPALPKGQKELETELPAGHRLGFRYDQLGMFIIRGLAARLSALEARG
jgi:hypothetical protein